MKIGRYAIGPPRRINPTRLPMYFSTRYGAKTRSGIPCQRTVPHARGASPGAPKGTKVFGARHGRRCGAACPLLDPSGTCQPARKLSAYRGKPEVARPQSKWRTDSNRTLRAPRQELWYPPSNAMGRFNEAAAPRTGLAERPRVVAGLRESTKWPGIPAS